MSRSLSDNVKAILSRLAKSGDMVAQALVQMCQEVKLTKGALSSGIIHVKAQVVDGLGAPTQGVTDVLLKTTTSNGGTLSIIPTVGTAKFGSGTGEAWIQTTSTGALEVDVEDGTPGELVLLEVRTRDGVSAILELQY